MAEKSKVTATKPIPKLPLHDLEATCKRFLDTVTPLLTEAELEHEKLVVKKLLENAQSLHKSLKTYAEDHDSFVEEFWNDSYLTPKDSVVLNLNPFFVLADDPTPARNNQTARAASLTYSALKFCCTYRSGKLAPDVFRGTPLCMSQYNNLFGSARTPNPQKDKLVAFPHEESTHIVVMRRGQIYYLECLNADHTLAVSETDLLKNFAAIVADGDQVAWSEANTKAVGVLTTENRHTWFEQRERLISFSDHNKEIFATIDQALFVVCLDHNSPQAPEELSANALHGTYQLSDDVQTGTCTNRWYDKLQLIITQNGVAGINFEHSGVDGHTVLRFVSDVFADTILRFAHRITKTMPSGGSYVTTLFEVPTKPSELQIAPLRMEWDLNSDLIRAIKFAEVRVSDKLLQCETVTLEYDGYGKDFIVANKLSPDSFVQLSFLFTYWKMYGWFVTQYEPVQTKNFLHGRTEAMRALSTEAKEFCRAFIDESRSATDKVALLRKATEAHSQRIKEMSQGNGFERHLFALKGLAETRGLPVPEFFQTSVGWKRLNHTILSTSNCGNPALRLFGFGPVVSDGFGIGYIIKEDEFTFVITSHHRQTQRFVTMLRQFLDDVRTVMTPEAPVVVGSGHKAMRDNTPGETTTDSESLHDHRMLVEHQGSVYIKSVDEPETDWHGYSIFGELSLPKQSSLRGRHVGTPIPVPMESTNNKSWKAKAGRGAGNEKYHFGDLTRASVKAVKHVLTHK
eukprot:c12803_g1_i1.p1 GENE.c12803_g1_i1~~c12803_g1_i1.p1  ORF type:complete len:741 (-),score=205.48 c12803_g1_i1:689-2911(-)